MRDTLKRSSFRRVASAFPVLTVFDPASEERRRSTFRYLLRAKPEIRRSQYCSTANRAKTICWYCFYVCFCFVGRTILPIIFGFGVLFMHSCTRRVCSFLRIWSWNRLGVALAHPSRTANAYYIHIMHRITRKLSMTREGGSRITRKTIND